MKKAFVGLTGASGIIYGVKLIETLLNLDYQVFASFTKPSLIVAEEELGISRDNFKRNFVVHLNSQKKELLVLLDEEEFNSAPASGSSRIDPVIVCPCSVSTLSHIAYGLTNNLIHRAADVALKERRKLVLVVRETPLSLIHIQAMEKVALAGGIVLPASPAFYHKPQTVQDLVDFIVGKILDAAGIERSLFKRYKS